MPVDTQALIEVFGWEGRINILSVQVGERACEEPCQADSYETPVQYSLFG